MVEERYPRLDPMRHTIAVFPMQQHCQIRGLGKYYAELAEIRDRRSADALASGFERAPPKMRAEPFPIEPVVLHQGLPFAPQPASELRGEQRQKKSAYLI